MIRPPPRSPLFPYTPLFRSAGARHTPVVSAPITTVVSIRALRMGTSRNGVGAERSEEHTSELQSPCNLVCRLLLEKKKKKQQHKPRLSLLQQLAYEQSKVSR